MATHVHPTAIVDDNVTIGDGTKIWHFAHICAGATIGENCIFGQNTMVAPDVKVGNNVKVQNNVSIYDAVTLEDDVFCGPSMVFTNVYNPRAAVTRTRCPPRRSSAPTQRKAPAPSRSITRRSVSVSVHTVRLGRRATGRRKALDAFQRQPAFWFTSK